ncbi:hypothetical protein AVEN_274412-1 [Araneus ventricosus]|uniref:Uncharacterized protein n=1 Tax=Araneus ventricosus TaxID=182803 RepID=A0A4Y2E7K0_ARAVE|nr:hypothetical protein AVEN_274412-1 [Araneus ventricosus]
MSLPVADLGLMACVEEPCLVGTICSGVEATAGSQLNQLTEKDLGLMAYVEEPCLVGTICSSVEATADSQINQILCLKKH